MSEAVDITANPKADAAPIWIRRAFGKQMSIYRLLRTAADLPRVVAEPEGYRVTFLGNLEALISFEVARRPDLVASEAVRLIHQALPHTKLLSLGLGLLHREP